MTTQPIFTPAEWDLLVGAPALTALVIIHMEQCGPDMARRKLQTALAAMPEPTLQGPGSELVAAVSDAARAGHSPRWPTEYPRELTNVCGWALECCRQAAALLAQKAPEAEAEAFSQWLLAIGRQVAQVTEDDLLPDHVGAAGTLQASGALDQLAIVLEVPFAADGMCALGASWQTPVPGRR